MRKWRRGDDDDILSFDDLDLGGDEPRRGRRSLSRGDYLPPRPIQTHYDEGDAEESEDACDRFDEIEAKIRSGEYKPQKSDPWNAHVLYNMLKSMGEI